MRGCSLCTAYFLYAVCDGVDVRETVLGVLIVLREVGRECPAIGKCGKGVETSKSNTTPLENVKTVALEVTTTDVEDE